MRINDVDYSPSIMTEGASPINTKKVFSFKFHHNKPRGLLTFVVPIQHKALSNSD